MAQHSEDRYKRASGPNYLLAAAMGAPSLLDAVPRDVLLHMASFADARSLARVAQASQPCHSLANDATLWRALDTEKDSYAPPECAITNRTVEVLAPRYRAATLERVVLVRGLRVSAATVHAFLHRVAGLGSVATDEFDEPVAPRSHPGRITLPRLSDVVLSGARGTSDETMALVAALTTSVPPPAPAPEPEESFAAGDADGAAEEEPLSEEERAMYRAMERNGIGSILERAKRIEAYYGDRHEWDRALRVASHADATERADEGEEEEGGHTARPERGAQDALSASAAGTGSGAPAAASGTDTSTEGAALASEAVDGPQWTDAASPLRRLDIASCWRVTDAGIRAITPACANLRTLNLSSCSALDGGAIVGCLRAARATLEDVQLRLCMNVEDWTVAELARCPRLRRVDLFGCTNVTDHGIVALAEGTGRHLREVNFSGMQDLTDAALHALAAYCGNLEACCFASCPSLSSAGVSTLAAACGTGLRELSLARCWRVDGDAVFAVAAHCGPSLHALDLSRCVRVSNEALIALGHRSLALQALCLAGCPQVSDAAVEAVAGTARTLRELNLFDCAALTQRAAAAIAVGLPHLRRLSLLGCPRVPDRAVEAVMRRCPELVHPPRPVGRQRSIDLAAMADAFDVPALGSEESGGEEGEGGARV